MLLFGYVKAYKPELKIKDYEAYKSVYCTLCTKLGKEYGLFSRLTLSYDFTFFALVRLAVSSCCPQFKKGRCCVNPLKKCVKCGGGEDEFKFTCAVAMIMLYYKVLDDISDKGFWKKIAACLLYPFAAHAHNKAKRNYPEAEEIIKKVMDMQRAAENERTGSIDKAAHPSADMMAKLLSFGFEGDNGAILNRLGYCVGRWVYITDALDDFEKDCKRGNYNPFAVRSGYRCDNEEENKKIYSSAEKLLGQTSDEAFAAYELLNSEKFKPIIENVLDFGMNICTEEILKGKALKK